MFNVANVYFFKHRVALKYRVFEVFFSHVSKFFFTTVIKNFFPAKIHIIKKI